MNWFAVSITLLLFIMTVFGIVGDRIERDKERERLRPIYDQYKRLCPWDTRYDHKFRAGAPSSVHHQVSEVKPS